LFQKNPFFGKLGKGFPKKLNPIFVVEIRFHI